MKAIIIARASTEEQKEAGNSLSTQISRVEQYYNNKKKSCYLQQLLITKIFF